MNELTSGYLAAWDLWMETIHHLAQRDQPIQYWKMRYRVLHDLLNQLEAADARTKIEEHAPRHRAPDRG